MEKTRWQKIRSDLTTLFNYAGGTLLAASIAGPYVLLEPADDFLRARNLDPATTSQLSDRAIRVNTGTPSGQLMSYIHFNPFNAADSSYARLSITDRILGRCTVVLSPPAIRTDINATTGFPPEHVTRAPISAKDYENFIAFHEMRHCHSANGNPPGLTPEADADIHGIRAALANGADPSLPRTILYFRALNIFGASHDTALAIDAALNDRPPPPVAEIEDARKLLHFAVTTGLRRWCPDSPTPNGRFAIPLAHLDVHHIPYLLDVLSARKDALPPAAQRRLELFHEAVAYFMPEVAANKRAQRHARFPGTLCPAAPAPGTP